jgi:hypothetical protein
MGYTLCNVITNGMQECNNIYRILDGCEEIWILYSSGKNNISRVSAANEWDIVFDTTVYYMDLLRVTKIHTKLTCK